MWIVCACALSVEWKEAEAVRGGGLQRGSVGSSPGMFSHNCFSIDVLVFFHHGILSLAKPQRGPINSCSVSLFRKKYQEKSIILFVLFRIGFGVLCFCFSASCGFFQHFLGVSLELAIHILYVRNFSR